MLARAVGIADDVGGVVGRGVVEHFVAGRDDAEAGGGGTVLDVEVEVRGVDGLGGGFAAREQLFLCRWGRRVGHACGDLACRVVSGRWGINRQAI